MSDTPIVATAEKHCCASRLLVVVGTGDQKRRFLVHRVILEARSKVFTAMLKPERWAESGGTINLPDEDPDEFLLYYQTIRPAATHSINTDNFTTVLRWFDKYKVNSMIRRCDDFLHERSRRQAKKKSLSLEDLTLLLMSNLDLASRFDLRKSQAFLLTKIRKIFVDSGNKLFQIEDVANFAIAFTKDDNPAAVRDFFWKRLNEFLPQRFKAEYDFDGSLSDEQKQNLECLQHNNLLPGLLMVAAENEALKEEKLGRNESDV